MVDRGEVLNDGDCCVYYLLSRDDKYFYCYCILSHRRKEFHTYAADAMVIYLLLLVVFSWKEHYDK